jgi:hypothetical protein
MVVVGAGAPEVNGALLTLDAPENAAVPEEAVGAAEAVLFGFRTLGRNVSRHFEERGLALKELTYQ